MSGCHCWALICVIASTAPVSIAADSAEFPTQFEWGTIRTTDQAVELHVEIDPDDRKLRIPRINNPYRKIYLRSDERQRPLKFQPGVSEWVMTLPPSAEGPLVVVMETVGRPQLLTKPWVTAADQDGTVTLAAHHAVVHGKLLRYEPQPHKNTVGYWAQQDDWCEWKFKARPGRYHVHILQGCGKGHGDSKVELSVGDSRISFTVEDTGHFQNFRDRQIGILNVVGSETDVQTLEVRALRKAHGAVMDVRQIRLVPVP